MSAVKKVTYSDSFIFPEDDGLISQSGYGALFLARLMTVCVPGQAVLLCN